MSLFVDWNALLLAEYFPPSSEGDESWLQASRHDLDSFALHLGGADGLVEAVRQGAPWMAGGTANCAELARGLARQRRALVRPESYVDPGSVSGEYVGVNAPTYLPILALWVLASSEAEDGFYAHVSQLVGSPFPNTPQLTSAMSEAWEDLQLWSMNECAGRFGTFRHRILGEHRFVGTPRSQCLVSRKDDRGIRLLLVACGLRPGQSLTPSLLESLAELAGDAHYLSNSLRTAFQKPQYRDPLQHILEKVLHSWDGRRPERESTQQPVRGGGGGSRLEEVDATTLALSPSDREEDDWDIRWRFRRSGQGNACQLVFGGVRMPARLEPWGDGFATVAGQPDADVLRSMLSKSGTSDVAHTVEYDDAEFPELGGGVRVGKIAHRQLRILAWDAPDPRAGEELVERELPLAGPAYVACSPAYSSSLKRYLANEGIDCTSMPPRGLPEGWTLTCIMRSEQLGSSQRQWLSDEEETQFTAARLRFVGGRPILRGGSRLYAPYDLPVLEVELRGGETVECSGMRLEELGRPASPMPAAARSPVRRFRLTIVDAARTVFEVRVVERERILASARIKISAPEGTGSGLVRQFSIDRFGRPRCDSLGLRGVWIGDDAAICGSALDSPHIEVGGRRNQSTIGQPQASICGKFLDSLAQLGSVGYGAARDQLSRLAEAAGAAVQPALLLLDLRCRAHLEIETDEKGHLMRVHAVKPFLYSLPARQAGDQLFGIGGTLRSQQWLDILGSAGLRVLLEDCGKGTLPTLRVACDDASARTVAGLLGLDMAVLPCDTVSRWAGSLDQARAALASWGWGSLSADLGQLQRLQPNAAQFRAANVAAMVVDPATKCQLFRFDDPSVPGLQVYVLGMIDPDGVTRYSFIHDSRWGVWLSELAFARMVREMLGRTDAYPWPIHYDPAARELWIPARIKPPAVIERALALCSGSGPRAAMLQARPEGDGLVLYRQDIGTVVGVASWVYEGFVPGVWLCYEWVPPEVAARVAALLGGDLRSFVGGHRWADAAQLDNKKGE
jgi:hypothetical protein